MDKSDPYYEVLTEALEDPDSYKVCTVCGCIAEESDDSCPYCYAYRFYTDPEVVSNTALDQLARPFNQVTDSISSAYD